MRHRLAVFGWLLSAAGATLADGGIVRASEGIGPYKLTVFTSPTPLRAGTADVSVLVQDGETGKPVDGCSIRVEGTHDPGGSAELHAVLTHASATNKLLQAAEFTIPRSGRWDMTLVVEELGSEPTMSFSVDVLEPRPKWQTFWVWFTWPAVPIALFVVGKILSGRRRRATAG